MKILLAIALFNLWVSYECRSQKLSTSRDLLLIGDNYALDTKIVVSESKKLVAIGTSRAPIQISNLETGTRIYAGTPQSEENDSWESFNVLGFTKQGTSLIAVTRRNDNSRKEVVFYNSATGNEEMTLPSRAAYLSQDGSLLLYDNTNREMQNIYLFNTVTLSIIDSINFPAPINQVYYPTLGSVWFVRLVTDSGSIIREYSKTTNKEISRRQLIDDTIYDVGQIVDVSISGNLFAIAATKKNTNDRRIHIVNYKTKESIFTLDMKLGAAIFLNKATFSPDEQYFSYPLANKVITVRADKAEVVDTTYTNVSLMHSVAWLSDSRSYVATNGLFTVVHELSSKKNSAILSIDVPNTVKFYDNDDKMILASTNILMSIDLKNNAVLWQTDTEHGVSNRCFDINEKESLVSYSLLKSPNTVVLHSLLNNNIGRVEIPFTSIVKSLRISSAGKYLIVSYDNYDFTIVNITTLERTQITVDSTFTGLFTVSDFSIDDEAQRLCIVYINGVLNYTISGTIIPDNNGQWRRPGIVHDKPSLSETMQLYGKVFDFDSKVIAGKNTKNQSELYEVGVYEYVNSSSTRISTYPDNSGSEELLYLTLCDKNRVAAVRSNGIVYVWDWKNNTLLLSLEPLDYLSHPMVPTPFMISSSSTPTIARVTKKRRFLIGRINDTLLSVNTNDDDSEQSVTLLPQPTNGLLRIIFPEHFTRAESIELFSIIGLKVFTAPSSITSGESIDVSALPSGVYTLRATSATNKSIYTKVVIQH